MKVSSDDDIPNIWKNKIHVPNHQPVIFPCLSKVLGGLGISPPQRGSCVRTRPEDLLQDRAAPGLGKPDHRKHGYPLVMTNIAIEHVCS